MGVHACLARELDRPWDWASIGVQSMGNAALDCKLAAEDCATERACAPDSSEFAASCAENGFGDHCAGDTWVACGPENEPVFAMDCAASGQSCSRSIWAGCGTEACEFGASQPACDPDDPDVLIECSPSGTITRVDCRTQNNYVIVHGQDTDEVYTIAGTTCGYDEQKGSNGCIGTGDACDFFSQRCDGDVLETCSGGKLTRRDCASLTPAGQGCGFIQSGSFAGAASCGVVEGACSLDDDETCADGKIGYCEYGEGAEIDCRALGYGGCATAKAQERTVAYCTP